MNRKNKENKLKNLKNLKKHNKIIVSGGGTGGHVFPAIAIADELKSRENEIEILFVGAKNRLEMEKVPQAGYNIVGLPIEGIHRKQIFQNIKVLFKLLNSLMIARNIIKEFTPDVVVGVGGYASGPVLRAAIRKGIPTLIQEQNSYAGITNRLLSKRVSRICVAYPGMERYFPEKKIVLTGNPVRADIRNLDSSAKIEEALQYFKMKKDIPVLLVLGGSLGARTINLGVTSNLIMLREKQVQVLWQCGKYYHNEAQLKLQQSGVQNIFLKDFIARMDLAYASANVIISRAGAITISELCHAGKPAILVPSPNVAEDHQTKNARALVGRSAAIHISDAEAVEKMIPAALDLLENKDRMKELSTNISGMAIENSTAKIVDEIIDIMN